MPLPLKHLEEARVIAEQLSERADVELAGKQITLHQVVATVLEMTASQAELVISFPQIERFLQRIRQVTGEDWSPGDPLPSSWLRGGLPELVGYRLDPDSPPENWELLLKKLPNCFPSPLAQR